MKHKGPVEIFPRDTFTRIHQKSKKDIYKKMFE